MQRVKFVFCVVFLSSFAVVCSVGQARAETISVQAGPDAGETTIRTPWGEYVAYDEGAGSFWVGKRRNYDRQRVIGIAQSDNFRLSTVNEDSSDGTFVQAGTLRTHVGGVVIDALSTEIDFGDTILDEHNRPSNKYRDVDVSWIQSPSSPVKIALYDSAHRVLYQNSQPAPDIGDGWHVSTIAVAKSALMRPIVLIVTTHGARPTLVSLRSIAQQDYTVTTLDKQGMGQLGVSTTDDSKRIRFLEQLDPSLALGEASPAAAKPQHTSSPPNANGRTDCNASITYGATAGRRDNAKPRRNARQC